MMAPNAVGGVSRLERERLTFSLGGSKSASYRPIVLKKSSSLFPAEKYASKLEIYALRRRLITQI
jgi:hypothetical protein